jgi:hypothetical protein
MKALPIANVFQVNKDQYFDCSHDILEMCTAPTKRLGIEVELIRPVGPYKPGMKGIARPFNAVDIEWQHKNFKSELKYKIMGLPDLNKSFDFYPFYTREGRKEISQHHIHISRFDFKKTKFEQLQFEFD